jgi:hypothetical protein
MTRKICLGIACAAIMIVAAPTGARRVLQAAPAIQAGAAEALSAAAKASPALVGQLSKEMGSTTDQAAGAAGALFGLAKSRMKADDFSKVSKAVPGMDLLLKAAPALAGGGGAAGAMSQMAGSASGLAAAASAFSKLGLSPDMVSKAVPILTSFVSKGGGADVGKLLAGVLK